MANVIQFDSISAVTISNSEISIISGTTSLQANTTPGVYQLIVDGVAAAMVKGDEFEIKIKEKTLSGSTQRTVFSARISDVQSEPWVSPTIMLLHGWDMTLIRTAGADKNFDASIRSIG